MRANTIITWGMRFVGDARAPDVIKSESVIDAMRSIATLIAQHSMATRFDISIARNESEVLTGLGRGGRKAGEATFDSIDSMFDELFPDELAEGDGRQPQFCRAFLPDTTHLCVRKRSDTGMDICTHCGRSFGEWED